MVEVGDLDRAAGRAGGSTKGDNRTKAVVLAPPHITEMFPAEVFHALGCDVVFANTIAETLAIAVENNSNIAVLPLRVNGRSTKPLICDLLKQNEKLAIIVVSQSSQIDEAAEAMRLGAADCIFLPFSTDRLRKTIGNVVKKIAPQDGPSWSENPFPNNDVKANNPAFDMETSAVRHGMVLSDISMKPVLHALDAVAASDAPIFIQGERGVGKELLARAFHAESSRASDPFVIVDCANLKPDNMATQLFSDPSDASHCDTIRGTLFLDEVARADLDVQRQLTEILERKEISPNESTHPVALNARIISGSTDTALIEVAAGRLRQDLFHHLNVVPIVLPALRERGEDIAAIANRKLIQAAETEGRRLRSFAPEAMDVLKSHPWTGNIRQLIKVIWNIVQQHDGEIVTVEMLPIELMAGVGDLSEIVPSSHVFATAGLLGRSLFDIERLAIEETIRSQGGSIPRAAKILGVSPSTIYRKRETWSKP